MTTKLSFRDIQFNIISRRSKTWLSSSDIAKALEYKSDDAVTRIYARNAEEFTHEMTETVKLTVSGNYQKTVRIFSLRGAHLIAMFARTPIAKEFRRWVLDILDKEISDSEHTQPINIYYLDTIHKYLWDAHILLH